VSTPDSTSSQAFGISEIALGDGRVVVQLAGELDVGSAPRVADTLERLTSDGQLCAFDLSRVTFIDSSGLRVLLLAARADAAGGAIPVTGPLPQVVERLFDLLGVGDRVRLQASS
jgi:anti-sigma B factor antagonist